MAAVFASIFGVGAAAMLVMLDFGVARFAEAELHGALRHQMAIMRADAQLEGSQALANILAEHVRTDTVSRYRYLVIPPAGPRFNSGLPEAAIGVEGFGTIEAPSSDVSSIGRQAEVRMLVLTERMADGSFMAVGRESYPLDELRTGLHKIAIWGSLALMVLAVVAGLFTGLLFLRRLELVNATTGRIMDGNLSERLPAIGFGQEFDDLTANLNAMLDRLEGAMSAMRQVSTDVAHDLRMPLMRLRNRLEELQPASEAEAARIESAIGEADELLSLFNTMLRVARLEAGDVRREMVPVDLSLLVDRAIDAYQPAAEHSGHVLRGRTEHPHTILGDAAMLSQLLANLIDNGLQHTPAGTTVEISLSTTAESVRLFVRDNGPGVGEEEIPNLPKRFYRADHSRTRPGTGLGLTLVSAIVDLHKASMHISGQNPGFAVEVRFKPAGPL